MEQKTLLFNLEDLQNFEFKKVDFNNPQSIIEYGNDVLETLNEIQPKYFNLLKDIDVRPIDFSEDIDKVKSFATNMQEIGTKSGNDQTDINLIKKLSQVILKMFSNEKKDDEDIVVDSYADIIANYCDAVDNLCIQLEEQKTNTMTLLGISQEYELLLQTYQVLINKVIEQGEADKETFINELMELDENDYINATKLKYCKQYIAMFEEQLNDLRASIVSLKTTEMDTVAARIPHMNMVKMWNKFIHKTAFQLKSKAFTIVDVKQQSDKLSRYQQLLTAVDDSLKENSSILKENIEKSYKMDSAGNIKVQTLLQLKDETIELFNSLDKIQKESFETKKANAEKISSAIDEINKYSSKGMLPNMTDTTNMLLLDANENSSYPNQKVLK